jgi:aryl-alcohol dehydrogenase-like predicted oxidoreductase
VHPISAVQVEYSPFCLDIESPKTDVLKTCRELGISIIAYSPIGRGLLTGQIKSFDDLSEMDFRRQTPKYSRENFPKILDLVAKMEIVAKKHGSTVSQVGLAWLLAQGEDIIPIPGTRTIKYLEENTKAMDVQLTKEEVKELRLYAEETELIGDRYPAM